MLDSISLNLRILDPFLHFVTVPAIFISSCRVFKTRLPRNEREFSPLHIGIGVAVRGSLYFANGHRC